MSVAGILLAAKIASVATSLIISGASTALMARKKRNVVFPLELLPKVAGLVVGEFLFDLVLLPEIAKNWDAIMTLLNASKEFRRNTLDILCALYGLQAAGAGKTQAVVKYKETKPIFRRLSSVAHDTPAAFGKLSAELFRRPSAPVVKLWLSVLGCIAEENAFFKSSQNSFISIITGTRVKQMRREYNLVPKEMRGQVLGLFMRHVNMRHAAWLRLKAVHTAIDRVSLFCKNFSKAGLKSKWENLPFGLGQRIKTRTDLTKRSSAVRALVAHITGIPEHDLPELKLKEVATACILTGLREVLSALSALESSSGDAGLGAKNCQYARNYLAIHFTENEREVYMPGQVKFWDKVLKLVGMA